MEKQTYKIGMNWIPGWGMAICYDEQDVKALEDLIERHLITGKGMETFQRWPGEE